MSNHTIHSSRREVVLLEPSVTAVGVAIYDVCDLLPRLKGRPPQARRKADIEMITLHHSDSSNNERSGFQSLLNCAQFCIRPESKVIIKNKDGTTRTGYGGRGFRAIAYHFWIPRYDDIIDGYRVIYRGLRDTEIGSNCKGINARNVGIAFQGNTTTVPVSTNHQTCLSALVPYLMNEYKIKDPSKFFGHCHAGSHGGQEKPACPGKSGTALILAINDFSKRSQPA